ncbi:SigE family RNA polymerase sigma factor [Catenulispora pinisilvae]|uniref:SigE family RNA polymerase sigma factor n=1 Tax=Catenulispora pinisilvae TaxID=2705253 RepID=UPI001892783C|nr:SigE family RNA polymerase sigma factor [Catenulispora pinisilvae]
MDRLEGFAEYAGARQRHLRRSAYLLCGDWHLAEDLTQMTLVNLCRSWGRAQRAASLDAYAHTVLVNTFLRHKRKYQRQAERAAQYSSGIPETAPADSPDLRLSLQAALQLLPARARAVVVLRFWEDLSVEATAAALGCSIGNVKSQTSRALARLREIVGDSLIDTGLR